MSGCSTRRHSFLLDKEPCALVWQEDMFSLLTTRHVLLLNSKTVLLFEDKTLLLFKNNTLLVLRNAILVQA